MKNKSLNVLIVLLIYSTVGSYAQETRFFMPSEIRNAYENQTRSYDGKPGQNYWQNTIDYSINVTIIPTEMLIEGQEEVIFRNNSTDQINTLVIRLYGDVLKKGNSRDYVVKKENLTNGVELENISINDTVYDLSNRKMIQRYGTNLYLTLSEPLEPGSELTFKASWKQKIPSYFNSRTAAYDSSTFFIAYWYPQISVYDDIFGWDKLDYTYRTEFYNNLANFDVTIEVPNNFIVWATGELQNNSLILPEEINNKFLKAKTSSKTVQIISKQDLENGIKTLNNIWHFKASEVTDFAFALSDHYIWDAGMQKVDGRNVLINSAYPLRVADNCSKLVSIQQKAMKYFSEDIPGISYPYETFTTFISKGGMGMEFPMIANNGQPDIPLTVHELFHSYFPMYVRTNEKRWAWMDEGWAVYNTLMFTNRVTKIKYDLSNGFYYEYGFTNAGTICDLPLITSSEFLSGVNYDFSSYQMPAMVIATLHHHLGEELFLKCYREYIKRWAKKSPTPYDFFYTFEDVSKQDLSWLWEPWFFEFGTVDIAIDTFKQNKMLLNNKGTRPVPVFIEINYKSGDKKYFSKSAKVWANGVKKIDILIPNLKNAETIWVNTSIADIDYRNNVFPSLKSIYKNVKIQPEILGNYLAERYYFDISINRKEELIYIDIPALGISRIIYPKDKNHFQSIDGSISLKFNEDESNNIKSFVLDLVGWIITCNKKI